MPSGPTAWNDLRNGGPPEMANRNPTAFALFRFAMLWSCHFWKLRLIKLRSDCQVSGASNLPQKMSCVNSISCASLMAYGYFPFE